MYVRPGQYTNVMHRYLIILFEKAVKNQVARQDPRYGDSKEGRDAKHAYSLAASTAKMDWPCFMYKNA